VIFIIVCISGIIYVFWVYVHLYFSLFTLNLTKISMIFNCGLKLRLIIIVIVFLFLPPRRWPHKWPKHVNGSYVIKLLSYTEVYLMVLLKICIHLMNARNMEHITLYSPLMGRSSHSEKRWNKSSREDDNDTAIPKFPFSRNLKFHCRVYKIPIAVLGHRTLMLNLLHRKLFSASVWRLLDPLVPVPISFFCFVKSCVVVTFLVTWVHTVRPSRHIPSYHPTPTLNITGALACPLSVI